MAIDYEEPRLDATFAKVSQQEGDRLCFAACVASLLGLYLENVPNFCAAPPDWWDRFQLWLCERGLYAIEVKLIEHSITSLPLGIPVILSGMGPRGVMHSVVGVTAGAEGFTLKHDPHPSQDFFGGSEPTEVLFIVRLP